MTKLPTIMVFFALVTGSIAEEPSKVKLCDLVRQQLSLSGEIVEVSGRLEHWGEGIGLKGLPSEKCRGTVLLDLETRDDRSVDRKDPAYQKLLAEIRNLSRDVTAKRDYDLIVRMTGRFDHVFKMQGGKRVQTAKGYGHLTGASRRLIIYRVIAVHREVPLHP